MNTHTRSSSSPFIRKAVLLSALVGFTSISCADDVLLALSTQKEEFEQIAAAKIDILWVVDNSQSMAEEQAGIGANFQAFISQLISTGVNYHIGVVSTDPDDNGQLHLGTGQIDSYINPLTVNAADVFLENIKVGTSGAKLEKAFETASLALGVGPDWRPGQAATPPNAGFLRDDAALFIIMVSDENDKSFGPVNYYRKLFEGYKGPGNESLISVSAIVGPPGSGCASAEAGDRYVDLASLTGGVYASICNDFASTLNDLSLTASNLKARFTLDGTPGLGARIPCNTASVGPFCVTVDGNAVEQVSAESTSSTGYQYDANSNSIVFRSGSVPSPGQVIVIEYQPVLSNQNTTEGNE